jgi:arginase
MWTETGVDLGVEGIYCDAGDLKFTFDEPFAAIEKRVGDLLDRGLRPVSLGGDHSITLPILRAFGKHVPGLTVIHFDAHPDLYDALEGNRLSHACPFARVMEEGAATRLIQLGIRTMTGHQREQAKKFGVEVVDIRQLPVLERMKIEGPIYISLDVDVLDPAFAPGTSHREPGGMSVREVLAHIHAITGKIVGADIVEFNPAQDHSQITATVAAKLLKEIMGMMILN